MAFGVSGATGRAQMLGADVAVARFDARLQRGFAADYNITALAPVSGRAGGESRAGAWGLPATGTGTHPRRWAVCAGAGRVARRVPR